MRLQDPGTSTKNFARPTAFEGSSTHSKDNIIISQPVILKSSHVEYLRYGAYYYMLLVFILLFIVNILQDPHNLPMSSTAAQLVQYVVVRGDLLRLLSWPTGAVIAQACHASTAILWMHRNDSNTLQYTSDLDNMHKVILEVSRKQFIYLGKSSQIIQTAVECWLIPLIDIWIDTPLTLNRHLTNSWWTVGEILTDLNESIKTELTLNQLSIKMFMECRSSVIQGVD